MTCQILVLHTPARWQLANYGGRMTTIPEGSWAGFAKSLNLKKKIVSFRSHGVHRHVLGTQIGVLCLYVVFKQK